MSPDMKFMILADMDVYRQLSAQPPHRLLPLKKNLNHFCLDCHSVCDNVYCSLTIFSALAAVCTVDCAIEIVLITLHYIKLLSWMRTLCKVVQQQIWGVSFNLSFLCKSFRNLTVKNYENWCTIAKVIVNRSGVLFSETRGISNVILLYNTVSSYG